MNIKELLEMNIGRIASGGVTPSAPKAAYAKNSKIAYNIVKDVMQAPTVKEKFDILRNLKDGSTTNIIKIIDSNGKRYTIKSYDQSTGAIEISVPAGNNLFLTNVNDLEFKGKERTIGSSNKTWIFVMTKFEPAGTVVKNPNSAKIGRPAKKTYDFPNRLW